MSTSSTTTLADKLSQVQHNVPEQACKTIDKWVEGLSFDKVLKEGDTIPDGNLVTVSGETHNVRQCAKKTPLVLSFNLGNWCPYCTTEKGVLSEYNQEIEKLGAKLCSVSPERQEIASQYQKEKQLNLCCMLDDGGKFARSLGIVFDIKDKNVVDAFRQSGLDFDKYYGQGNNFYIVPSTFIIDSNGKIIRSHISRDYKNRMEPSEILSCLKKCSNVESS
jgi:peroxiredoxin